MAIVKDKYNINDSKSYRFRSNLMKKQILQIGRVVNDWDTNSGMDLGRPYVDWRDADRYEAEYFMKNEVNILTRKESEKNNG